MLKLIKNFAMVLILGLAVAGCATKPGAKSTGEVVDDAIITTKVKSALLADPDVSGLAINVDTYKGQVTLTGNVKSGAQVTRAEDIARGMKGVTSVKNNLEIKN